MICNGMGARPFPHNLPAENKFSNIQISFSMLMIRHDFWTEIYSLFIRNLEDIDKDYFLSALRLVFMNNLHSNIS
jgi:hypothetical protein